MIPGASSPSVLTILLLLLATASFLAVHGSFLAAFGSMVRTNHHRGIPFHVASNARRWSSEQKEGIPETQGLVQQDGPGYFDADLWEEYETTLRTVMKSGRVMRKDAEEEIAPAIACLLRNAAIVPIQIPLTALDMDYRQAVKEQRDLFMDQTGLGDKQFEFAIRTLTYLGDYCAKRRLPNPIKVAWHKLKESGMAPRENCISTYLYVLGMDEESSDLAAQVATFHDLLYEPNEKTVSLRVKALVAKEDAAGALKMLTSISVRLSLDLCS